MTAKRIHRKMERTPEQQRELKELRERLQQQRPNLDDFAASGDIGEVVSQGEYLDLCALLGKLKKHRERQGLSLADVSQRSGIDRGALSRLENGVYVNPTLSTLHRYAEAIGADIGFTVRTS